MPLVLNDSQTVPVKPLHQLGKVYSGHQRSSVRKCWIICTTHCGYCEKLLSGHILLILSQEDGFHLRKTNPVLGMVPGGGFVLK